MQLRRFQHAPPGLAECAATELAGFLGGPALVHVQGRRDPPLLVSVLLHGNEQSGWNGVRRLLDRAVELPRSLLLFIGNVAAAAANLRTLPHQQDYNRIWRGASGAEGALAREVLDLLTHRPLFAALDLHNNTGHNPHYSVLTDLNADNLGLAYLFSEKAVYVEEPDTVMTRAIADRHPALAVELGPIGDPRCDDRAHDFVSRCLALDAIPAADATALELYRAEVRVHVADEAPFSFAGDGLDTPLVLTSGVEGVNFHPLAAGTEFGAANSPVAQLLRVLDANHQDVTDSYFERRDGSIVLRQPVVPAMYTTDPLVIRQDCLCYFMKRMELADARRL
ncbi:MAG: succinylglutamate desuccinylase/aspartoacylase family protein [Pseudomonadales bacterium]